jgi:N-acetyl-alpha-D-muramate 1-phosphate uridylyltransferase
MSQADINQPPIRAMILAAGRGERMRPLTDTTPKPLLDVGGKPLIAHQIERLAAAGIRDIVINLAHLGEQIPNALGDGTHWGVRLHYSVEGSCAEEALETAGGIRQAIDWLSPVFLLVNGDVFSDIDLSDLLATGLAPDCDFRLMLVDNPEHHPEGDFGLGDHGHLSASDGERLTYAGIGLYRRALFEGLPEGRRALGQILHERIARGRGCGRKHEGSWLDVGTVERLEQARARA